MKYSLKYENHVKKYLFAFIQLVDKNYNFRLI